MRTFTALIGMLLLYQPISLAQEIMGSATYCTPEDFRKMTKIDAHCHLEDESTAFMEQAVKDHFRIITLNTDAPGNLPIADQQQMALQQKKLFPGQVAYLTTFSMQGWDDPEWADKTVVWLESCFQQGAIGVKVWKNIGMVEKDNTGKFIMIDDPKFDPVFDYLVKKGIPVCGHLGEPRNCWLPLDAMTVNNDRSYFREHPEYHMYLHPDHPSYEDQIRARDNLLRKHPDLHFIGAHMGSLEWSIDELAGRLEEFPNMTIDLAARICHVQKQAQEDWQKVHDFFIRYQDRILYGTDLSDGGSSDPAAMQEKLHQTWLLDWKFFTTDEVMTTWEVDGVFRGLKLPREVVEKIYYRNAARWLVD
jgi:predicted TIM-barrel fold metal-dependent hydrolase